MYVRVVDAEMTGLDDDCGCLGPKAIGSTLEEKTAGNGLVEHPSHESGLQSLRFPRRPPNLEEINGRNSLAEKPTRPSSKVPGVPLSMSGPNHQPQGSARSHMPSTRPQDRPYRVQDTGKWVMSYTMLAACHLCCNFRLAMVPGPPFIQFVPQKSTE